MKFTKMIALLTFVSAPLFAGIYYQADSKTTSNDRRSQDLNTRVEAWIDGENGKILFLDSDNPMASTGTYVVTTDGGKTMYLVKPKDKTYMEWDINQMIMLAGSMLEAMKGFMSIEFDNPEVEQLESGKGETIQGHATTHYKHKTAYGISIKVMGMKRYQTTETIQDTWVTKDLNDMALGMWLRKEPPSSGSSELDKLISNEMEKVKGFPLKSKSVSTVKQWNKKRTKVKRETTTTTDMVVTQMRNQPIPASTYEIPSDYTKTSMPGADGGNPLGDIFKRN